MGGQDISYNHKTSGMRDQWYPEKYQWSRKLSMLVEISYFTKRRRTLFKAGKPPVGLFVHWMLMKNVYEEVFSGQSLKGKKNVDPREL